MQLCESNIGFMDFAIFFGQLCLTVAAIFAGFPVGGLLARLVSLEKLEVMAKKPEEQGWLGICVSLIAMLVAAGLAVAMAINLKQFDHLSDNINATLSFCAFGLLMGLGMGVDKKVRERVDLVRTNHRALLKYF
jgi:hypothetical protein